MYTQNQKKVITYARSRVKALFEANPVKVHSFDHAWRVSKWAIIIAKAEKDNVFLAELSAWLHDVGRTKENLLGNTKTHHELSYEICREWFKKNSIFNTLSSKEKLIIFYTVRYHWNDMANKYKTGWILRDADKLDSFGQIGVKRTIEFLDKDEKKMMHDLRLRYEMLYNLKSKKSKQIMKSKNLFEPIHKFQQRILKNNIKPVEMV